MPSFFIDRPNFAWVVAIFIVLAGIISLPLLPVSQVAHAFDGKWLWTDAQGRTQPKVSVFDGLFEPTNPHLARVEATYKALALRLREGQCNDCHVPSNPDKSKRLVLLQTPAHAAAEIKRLLKSIRTDRMPRDQFGIEQPLDHLAKAALLEDGTAIGGIMQIGVLNGEPVSLTGFAGHLNSFSRCRGWKHAADSGQQKLGTVIGKPCGIVNRV